MSLVLKSVLLDWSNVTQNNLNIVAVEEESRTVHHTQSCFLSSPTTGLKSAASTLLSSRVPAKRRRTRMRAEQRGPAEEGGERRKGLTKMATAAAVVLAQSLLVAACLALTLFVYWDLQELASRDNVHIQFDVISDIWGNATLQFDNVRSSHHMGLADDRRSKIAVGCDGPYVLYVDVCYRSLEPGAAGTLRLRAGGRAAPLCAFHLAGRHEACEWLHAVAYLRAGEKVKLDLRSTGFFKIKNVTVGLSSLLGGRCEF
ncbi:uncharacterized protein LOC133503490 [Syngnathoides biaculeatus]|uniref:uncharacterized protein LOC133503490 n=1 Tax=Syngnathoides biaculeatus TaxID=300417 RepID=UPI002ADD3213|nr:uncharacterized protein LOC133503490 [Syngnathoides biaculeatus]